MQFGGAGADAVLGVTVHACFCILTVGCTGACSLGCWCWCIGHAGDAAGTFLHLDGRVEGGMQLGVLVQVAFWDAVWGAAGCLGGCCLGCS